MNQRYQISGIVINATATEYSGGCDIVVVEKDYFGILGVVLEYRVRLFSKQSSSVVKSL